MSAEQATDDKQLIKELERRLAEFQGNADKLSKEVESLQGANSSLSHQLESQRAETHQMQLMLEQIQREMRMQYLAAVKSFSNLMELRSPQLAAHGLRVAELARLIAKAFPMGWRVRAFRWEREFWRLPKITMSCSKAGWRPKPLMSCKPRHFWWVLLASVMTPK